MAPSRAEGRNTPLAEDFRIWEVEFEDIERRLPASVREERLYLLERLAWIPLQVGTLWVIGKRLGFPKKEEESLQILFREGILSLEAHRKLRYLIEARKLSARPQTELSPLLFQNSLVDELKEVRSFLDLAHDHLG